MCVCGCKCKCFLRCIWKSSMDGYQLNSSQMNWNKNEKEKCFLAMCVTLCVWGSEDALPAHVWWSRRCKRCVVCVRGRVWSELAGVRSWSGVKEQSGWNGRQKYTPAPPIHPSSTPPSSTLHPAPPLSTQLNNTCKCMRKHTLYDKQYNKTCIKMAVMTPRSGSESKPGRCRAAGWLIVRLWTILTFKAS